MSDKAMTKVSKSFPERSRSRARSLARDQGGAVAVMFALMLTALIGMMALAVDLGKAWNVQTELQHAADAACLAGATQLTGLPGSRVLAIQAATALGFVRNEQTFAVDQVDANDDTFADGIEVRFDESIAVAGDGKMANTDIEFFYLVVTEGSGNDPDIEELFEATTDAEANYIRCTTPRRSVPFSFAAVVGAVNSASPFATAMAYNGAAYCQVPPLFTCAPEDEEGNVVFPDEGDIGKGVWMKGGSPGNSLFPGNFGLLCLIDENGDTTCAAQDISDALARTPPLNVCFAANADLETKTGEVTGPVQNGINMRLGIYPQGNHKVPDGEFDVDANSHYSSSRNVVKGLRKSGGQCKENSFHHAAKPNRFPGPLQILEDVPYSAPYNEQANARESIYAMAYPRDDCAYQEVGFETISSDPGADPVIPGASATLGDGACMPGANGTSEDVGRIGTTGAWDFATYMFINHRDEYDILTSAGITWDNWDVDLAATQAVPILCSRCDPLTYDGVGPPYPRRFEVFEWERDSALIVPTPAAPMQPEDLAVAPEITTITETPVLDADGNPVLDADGNPVVTVSESVEILEDLVNDAPNCGIPAVAVESGALDRRQIPIAVVDCSADPTGKSVVVMQQVMVILLTEAVGFGMSGSISQKGQDNKNIYGEITGFSELGQLTTIEKNVIQLIK